MDTTSFSQKQGCVETLSKYKQNAQDIREAARQGLKKMVQVVKDRILNKPDKLTGRSQILAPSQGMQKLLNMLVHVGVLFLALVVLWITYIHRVEQETLEKEFISQIKSSVLGALDSDFGLKKHLKDIKALSPALDTLKSVFTHDDPARNAYNDMLTTIGFGLTLLIFAVVCALIFALAWNGVSVGKTVLNIVLENVVLFGFIGAIEYVFFSSVTRKFVPILPSSIVKKIITHFKSGFGGTCHHQ